MRDTSVDAAKVVDARIARMDHVAFVRGADDERRHRAVRLFLRGDRRQLDHQVRFQHQLLERLGGVFAVRRKALEQLLRCQNHLVGGLAPAALAAHAVGQHAHQAAWNSVVLQDLHLILLVGAVATMYAGCCR